jgi:hypothetical protein
MDQIEKLIHHKKILNIIIIILIFLIIFQLWFLYYKISHYKKELINIGQTQQYQTFYSSGLPDGWRIEQNSITKEWRWCNTNDYCDSFVENSKEKAIESAIKFQKFKYDRNEGIYSDKNWR